jgi:hypothetical protein
MKSIHSIEFILETRKLTIGGNGKIVIYKGRNEIFFLRFLHYNDTCKVNQQFTGGRFKMVKLNILNMKKFLDTVNACTGKVNMLCPDGNKQNINGEERVQDSLWLQYLQNKNYLRLVLEIPNPMDYMSIVSYYVGDC